MGKRRPATLVIVIGCIGMLVGRVVLGDGPGAPDLLGWLIVNLVLLGVAAWHFSRFGFAKLVVTGLVAGGAGLLTLFDAGSGPHAWARSYSSGEQVGVWLFIASAGVVLLGVVWSAISELPVGHKTVWAYVFGTGQGGTNVQPPQRGIIVNEGDPPPEGWWLASDGRWYPPDQRHGQVPPPPASDLPPTR